MAGGPSFTAAQARLIGIARASDTIRVIAVNDAVYPCWFADWLHACDVKWWVQHRGVPGFPGRKSYLDKDRALDPNTYPDIHRFENTGTTGVDFTPNCLRTGGNSGYQAIQIAIHLGATRIILCGFDMSGDLHWFGRHPDRLQVTPNQETRRTRFNELAVLLRDRISVVNASPGSALKCFPMVNLEQELQHAEVSANRGRERLRGGEEAAARREQAA